MLKVKNIFLNTDFPVDLNLMPDDVYSQFIEVLRIFQKR